MIGMIEPKCLDMKQLTVTVFEVSNTSMQLEQATTVITFGPTLQETN